MSTAEGEGSIDDSFSVVIPPNPDTEEEAIFENRAILYRFSSEVNDWVGRGVGQVKITKRKDTGYYRILMRNDQTYRVCLNHLVPYIGTLFPKKECKHAFAWTAFDFSDEPETRELFAIKFGFEPIATQFQKAYQTAQEANKALHEGK